MKNKIEISVIIPVFNTKIQYLKEALDSLVVQTLPASDFEVIFVDDCSTEGETIEFVKDLEKKGYEKLNIRVIYHATNQYQSEARNAGVEASLGDYICCLDSDDYLSENYLKTSLLILKSHPNAGWTYPNVQKFGAFNNFYIVPDFNARNLFFQNHCDVASLYKKEAWKKTGKQHRKIVAQGQKWFEDWDFFIRSMAKGYYGVPNRMAVLYYRQHISSTITRSKLLTMLTTYMVYRSNFWNYFKIWKSQKNYEKDLIRHTKQRNFLVQKLDILAGKIITRFTPFPMKVFPFKLLVLSLFKPRDFIVQSLASDQLPTLAAVLCGLGQKVELKLKTPSLSSKTNNKIVFAHWWWHMGGAENVFLDYMKSVKGETQIIDFIFDGNGEKNSYLEESFSRVADEQLVLTRMSTNPLSSINLCWEFLIKERPKTLFIMSNPFFYLLTPFIKKYLPATKIIDLLHCEDGEEPMWFGVSDQYKAFIDERIVTSEHWKKVLIEKYGEKPEKIKIAMNALDLKKFDPAQLDKLALRKKLKVDRDKFIIGFLGRFDAQKNPKVFLHLAQSMADDERFEFVMIGSGGLLESMRSELKELSNLKYFGATKNSEKYLSILDLAVFPSVYEGYPLVGMEAAALNVPIIATDIVGFREQVDLGSFGLLYPQGESAPKDALKIREIIYENLDQFEAIGKNGRTFVEKYHDFEKQKEVYKKILL